MQVESIATLLSQSATFQAWVDADDATEAAEVTELALKRGDEVESLVMIATDVTSVMESREMRTGTVAQGCAGQIAAAKLAIRLKYRGVESRVILPADGAVYVKNDPNLGWYSRDESRADLVSCLEADDYERLPGITFVRGMIRSYAKLLDIDAATLAAAPRPFVYFQF